MTTLSYLLVLLMVTYLEAMSNISRIPLPTPGFVQYKTYGQWYTVYIYPPCARSGRRNQNPVYSSGGKNALKLKLSWENDGFCNTVSMKKIMVSPGVYLTADVPGNVFSSKTIVVTTDYKSHLILWICRRFNVFGDMCEDPYILVLTRTPRLNARTIGVVDTNLRTIWGISIDDLRKVVHTGECYGGRSSWSFYKGK